MTRKIRALLVAAGLAATLAIPAGVSAQAPRTLTIPLAVQNNSGVSGTATLTEVAGGRTEVVIRVTPAGMNNMPAHIHTGRCPDVGPVVFPLQNVQNGTSTTEVNTTIANVLATPHAINLHRSPQEASIYTACGNLVAGAAALPATGSPLGAALPAAAGAGAALAGAAAVALRRRFR